MLKTHAPVLQLILKKNRLQGISFRDHALFRILGLISLQILNKAFYIVIIVPVFEFLLSLFLL